MKKKQNNSLIIAAAGSGKTTELINQIIQKTKKIPKDKYLVVITYTNAATNEIIERLQKKISLSPNIFVGTIHSFLIKFLIKPYGKVLGLVPNELIITDYAVSVKKTSSNPFVAKNMILNSLSERGILTYDFVVTLSKKILNDKEAKKRFCDRIMYLFVDEFQDCTKTQFEILETLRKGKGTELIFVGDPEQRIMNFRAKPRKGNVSLHPIIELQKKTTYSIRELKNNYRSSETIVNFINHFHCNIRQEWANKKITSKNPVTFIKSSKLKTIISDFNDLCTNRKYCKITPKKRFFLAYENKAYSKYRNTVFNDKSVENLPLIKRINEFLSIFYNIKKEQLTKELGFEEIELRKNCLSLFLKISNSLDLTVEEFMEFVETTFNRKKSVGNDEIKFNINQLTKKFMEELSNRKRSGQVVLSEEDNTYQDYFLTIHKSKGLQADGALILAKNEKELLAWLEVDKEKRLLDPQDKCRLGYVAFSRPKEFLCIACLTPISEPTLKLIKKFNVNIYHTEEDLTQIELPIL